MLQKVWNKETVPPKRPRVRISGPEELAGVWKEFLAAKFTPTELEKARSALEELPESKDAKDQITREEFDNAVNRMKPGSGHREAAGTTCYYCEYSTTK